MNVKLIGRMAVYTFELSRLDDESLHNQLVVLEQQFTRDVRIVYVARVRRTVAMLIGACSQTEESKQKELNSIHDVSCPVYGGLVA